MYPQYGQQAQYGAPAAASQTGQMAPAYSQMQAQQNLPNQFNQMHVGSQAYGNQPGYAAAPANVAPAAQYAPMQNGGYDQAPAANGYGAYDQQPQQQGAPYGSDVAAAAQPYGQAQGYNQYNAAAPAYAQQAGYAAQGNSYAPMSPGAEAPLQTPNMRNAQNYLPPEGVKPARSPSQSSAPGSTGRAASPKPRIHPAQVPRTQVEQEVVVYHTASGQVPPSANSQFVVVDEGNCSPRFIRMTTCQVAADQDLIDLSKLIVGAIIQPLADVGQDEEEVPVVDMGPAGPVRCSRCRAYMCPFFKFTHDGARMICPICKHNNEVPQHYQCNLDPNGIRRDKAQRPELCRGSVEYIATPEYSNKPVQDPCFLFVLDVSYSAIVTGFLHSALQAIKVSLEPLAANPRARVGIMTYSSAVHFYAIKPPRKEPQMYVVGDIDDVFVPVPPEELLVRVSDPAARTLLNSLLEMIPRIHQKAMESSAGQDVDEKSGLGLGARACAMGAAVYGGYETLKPYGGKLLVTQSNLPNAGMGALKNRDDIKLYYTDNEKMLFVPQDSFYEKLAMDCATHQISIDIFAGANAYVDLATIGALSEHSGGQLYFYEGFNSTKDGEALQWDLYRNVTRRTGFDGVMLVRVSSGLQVVEHFGNFFRRRPNEMELPTVDCDKTFGVVLKHETKLTDKSDACIQAALLYTNAQGERRIRVHSICLPVTSALANIFRNADLDAIISLSLKQACRSLLHRDTPAKVRQALVNACVDSLFSYRKFCAQTTSAGQLVLPETLKLLPLCTLGIIKHPFFHNGQRADERAFLFSYITASPAYVSVPFVAPRLFALHDIAQGVCVPDNQGRVFLPQPLTLSSESISSQGLYLLDDGRFLWMWIGDQMSPESIRELFDVDPFDDKIVPAMYRISAKHSDDANHLTTQILQLMYHIRKNKSNYPNLSIVSRKKKHDGGKQLVAESLDESQFFKHLIEDPGGLQSYQLLDENGQPKKKDSKESNDPAMMSYIDFLVYIHKNIQDKFH